ncbi:T9SS type A sorting domain-containing protein [Flavobacterium sp. NG2]|uniref:T9SS type A sorting domain-containing protein n=1 Tax=Flavobacterium sp. NG2 TaxID=3097547 RepID=UPI002A835653|nr:T9SS type A sorting domain-containing protein [Flavobacterium sp. NG2]WPR71277.1 T9SS type A sorting domain-containing protein [Flavobacterium sp. NG2]
MKKAFFFISILVCQFVMAQKQITNLNAGVVDKSSSPSNFIEFNNLLFFTATTESFGREIWVSNGNAGEAYLLKDINVGKENGIETSLTSSVIIGNTLYFIAKDEYSNGEIWKTDGTTSGTVKVTDFLNASISKLTLVGDKIFFLVNNLNNINKINKLDVWTSDGTKQGTNLVVGDLPIWNGISFQGECNGRFIFTFQEYGSNESRVWSSDGTSLGTFYLTDKMDGNGSAIGGTPGLSQYVVKGNFLYFVSRYYLYKTDGTVANTAIVAPLHNAQNDLVQYSDAIEIKGKLYFLFYQFNKKRMFIWESDGTATGTKKIYDKYNYNKNLFPSNLINHNNQLVFCGPNQTEGTSLVEMNLNDYSLTYIKELHDGIYSIPKTFFSRDIDVYRLQNTSDNQLFCFSNDNKAWISKYTEAATIQLPNLESVKNVFESNRSYYFQKSSGDLGVELWKTDGTNNGSFLLDNINKSKSGVIIWDVGSLDKKLVFGGYDGESNKIWVYKEGDLSILKEIRLRVSYNPDQYQKSFIEFKNELYFLAGMSSFETKLWKTDGTSSGTVLAIDSGSSDELKFINLHNGFIYFFVTNYSKDEYKLYRTDGTSYEFIKSLGFNDYGQGFNPIEVLSIGDKLYFTTQGAGSDLWVSDGTSGGTKKIKDFSSCSKLTDVNGKLFFVAAENSISTEIWSSNGTEITTKKVSSIGNGFSSEPNNLIAFNNELYFTAFTNEYGREIWKTDGTENGTVRITDISLNAKSSIVKNPNFTILKNELFFNATDGFNGFELWKTNGSVNGETLVKDINPGVSSSSPTELKTVKEFIYFQAYNAEKGSELWKTDGTTDGTVLCFDLYEGIDSSLPSNIFAVENDIFFIAESLNTGRQIWKNTYVAPLGIEDFSVNTVSIFPNPANDFVNINSKGILGAVEIYSMNGNRISQSTLDNNKVDLSTLKPGLYILKFRVNDKMIFKKIVKY